LLQNRKIETCRITRVPAPEIEQLVLNGVHAHLRTAVLPSDAKDREPMERHVDRFVVRPQALEARLTSSGLTAVAEIGSDRAALTETATAALMVPWIAANFIAAKGIVREPDVNPVMTAETRDTLLAAIAGARRWIEHLRLGRVATSPSPPTTRVSANATSASWLRPHS
jgi:hypothetical protein